MTLWISWMMASMMAFGIGGRLGRAFSPTSDLIVIGFLALGSSLLLAGMFQWLLMRGLVSHAGRWVGANILAVTVIGILVFGLGLIHRDVGWVVGVVAGWVLLGVFQWLVLRGQVAGAGWWILAHMLGLLLAIPAVGLITTLSAVPTDAPFGGFLRWLAFGGAHGVVTGTTLSWMLSGRAA